MHRPLLDGGGVEVKFTLHAEHAVVEVVGKRQQSVIVLDDELQSA